MKTLSADLLSERKMALKYFSIFARANLHFTQYIVLVWLSQCSTMQTSPEHTACLLPLRSVYTFSHHIGSKCVEVFSATNLKALTYKYVVGKLVKAGLWHEWSLLRSLLYFFTAQLLKLLTIKGDFTIQIQRQLELAINIFLIIFLPNISCTKSQWMFHEISNC